MVKLNADWLQARRVKKVFSAFQSAGFEVFAVGGSVRNTLLDQPISDVDFATNATPQQVLAMAKSAGLKAIPTGIDHGTVTLVIEGLAYEVTTYRHDLETDGRHAKIAFAQSMAEDAARRDFTMNALYCDAAGEVLDPVNGLPDLFARRVRFVGDPLERIAEDYLRILRFFRFHAWYGDPEAGFDAEGLAACAELAEGLAGLSAERIGAEMARLLAAPNPAPTLASMERTGILNRLLPGATAAMMAPLVHFEEALSLPPVWQRRLAVLGGEDVADRLRLSRADARRLETIRSEIAETHSLDWLGYNLGADLAVDIMLAKSALSLTAPPKQLLKKATHAAAQTLPVRAADLDPSLRGPEIGAALRDLEEAWIASGFRLSKADLLA